MNVLALGIIMRILFILLFMIIFVVIYWPEHNFSIIFMHSVNFGCLPVFGQIFQFFLWKNPDSPRFENSSLTGMW